MKITDFALLFTALFLPLSIILGMHSGNMRDIRLLEMKYGGALRTAVQDGAVMLNFNEIQSLEAGYESFKRFRADKERALAAFSKTLYLNLGIQDDVQAQNALWWYLPVIAVMDYDGYYVYSMESISVDDGQELMKHVWSPKIPYVHTDSLGNVVHFTLDSSVEAFHQESGTWFAGWQHEVEGMSGITLLDESVLFDEVRRRTIVNAVQKDLAFYINRHNEIASRNGISYRFSLPVIPQEEWVNSVDDIGLMAFIQGIPVGDRFYNNYALGGGRLVKNPDYYGGVDPATGLKYFYQSSCSSYPYEVREIFDSPRKAAEAGYREKRCHTGST